MLILLSSCLVHLIVISKEVKCDTEVAVFCITMCISHSGIYFNSFQGLDIEKYFSHH